MRRPPEVTANAVRLHKSHHSCAVVVVEGPSDITLYRRFVDQDCCQLEPGYSKADSIAAMKILEESSVDGVLAIVDANHMCLSGIVFEENIYCTDTHDLETVLIESESFDKLLFEFGSDTKLKRLDADVLDMLLQNGLPLGYFRWLSTSKNLNLKFENLRFNRFITRDFQIDIDDLFNAIKDNSQRHDLPDAIIEEVQDLVDEGRHSPYDVCCGPDLIEILAIGLRTVFGNSRAQQITTTNISSHLRTGYELGYFQNTRLYDSIKAWEEDNPEYRVFAC